MFNTSNIPQTINNILIGNDKFPYNLMKSILFLIINFKLVGCKQIFNAFAPMLQLKPDS